MSVIEFPSSHTKRQVIIEDPNQTLKITKDATEDKRSSDR
jgi:hypothetical protein